MAEICCGLVSDREASPPCESSRAARRRRMQIRRVKVISEVAPSLTENEIKKPRIELSLSRHCYNAVENSSSSSSNSSASEEKVPTVHVNGSTVMAATGKELTSIHLTAPLPSPTFYPKFGVASVCGRRRDMEDAVAIHPSFCRLDHQISPKLHYFGVYDGHGCSHVAIKCKERLHELVKDELESKEDSTTEWKKAMERSFMRMEKEVIGWNESMVRANCRCELQTPECDAVGSTAVVAIVTPDKIIVANCGDSRAVLCRKGKPLPLSNDHKPDRPDELNRIQAAGGRVIYWDGPRVLGVLAMSRAIGDNYLKPYVICEPEVTIMDRTDEDDCLILASDGLWDVVSNETACGVARMCLKGKGPAASSTSCLPENDVCRDNSDKACSDASTLLTKLALARRSADNVSVVVIDLRKDT